MNPQFNLESPNPTISQYVLRRFRPISSAPTADLFELQVALQVPKLKEGSILVFCLLKSPASSVEVADPPDTILLESWTISFSEYGDGGYQGSGLPEAYKQGISMFRVAYTLLRWLPAWKLRNELQRRTSPGELEGLEIELRVRFHQAEYVYADCGGTAYFRTVYIMVLTPALRIYGWIVSGHSGQSTTVWELAPMELPAGSLQIRV